MIKSEIKALWTRSSIENVLSPQFLPLPLLPPPSPQLLFPLRQCSFSPKLFSPSTTMAPQAAVPLAATVLGTIGTVFWSIQLLPQIYFNNQLKDTEGMPALMMLLWAISAIPFGVYAIVQKFAIPLQVQPQIFCTFTLVCWGQIMRYHG